jgi:uncharacterized protein YxjI
MKKAILFMYLITSTIVVLSQTKNKLIGKWQAESLEITSMYHDSYQFFSDGRFIFKPDEYDGLRRIISINGTYKIKRDTLFLTPEFTKEVTGGYPIRSESTTLSDTWEIIQGQTKTFPCKKRLRQSAIIEINPDNKSFTLDERKFFKVDE